MRPPYQTCTSSPRILASAYRACTVASLEFAGLQSPWQSYYLPGQNRLDASQHSDLFCHVCLLFLFTIVIIVVCYDWCYDCVCFCYCYCRCYACPGPGLHSSRPAYSPDAFDDHAKKGSKLAQRLLGGGKSVTGKLMPEKKLVFGSHVAGRSNHTWSNGLDTGDFEGASTSRAAEVQQVQQ